MSGDWNFTLPWESRSDDLYKIEDSLMSFLVYIHNNESNEENSFARGLLENDRRLTVESLSCVRKLRDECKPIR